MLRTNIIVTAALLSALVGIVAWALQPTQKVFSWVETSRFEYLAGFVPGRDAGPRAPGSHIPIAQYQDALGSLKSTVERRYFPFVAMGSMGNRLTLESGESF